MRICLRATRGAAAQYPRGEAWCPAKPKGRRRARHKQHIVIRRGTATPYSTACESAFGLRVAQPRNTRGAKRGARRSPKGEDGLDPTNTLLSDAERQRPTPLHANLPSGYAWRSRAIPEGRSVVPGEAQRAKTG